MIPIIVPRFRAEPGLFALFGQMIGEIGHGLDIIQMLHHLCCCQLLTIEAALTLKRDAIYHAALLDPHTSAELPMDKIIAMCDELIEAHGDYLPKYH